MPRLVIVLVVWAGVALTATPVRAQAPQAQPLVQFGNFAYLGKFVLPLDDGAGAALTYGGAAIGIGPDGTSLYFGCHSAAKLARVRIPALGGLASVVEPCTSVPGLGNVNPGDPNGFAIGGSLSWNGRLITTGYAVYDASRTSVASHFAGPSLAQLQGPHRVGTDQPGLVAGYMGVVPVEWRTLLGGPALTGQCCISIISRTSYGPSVSVFDPDTLGTGATPSRMLLGYPEGHESLGGYTSSGPYFSGSTRLGGVAFPAGTRSVLFVGRQGTTSCYGTGTANASLHGTPHPSGGVWCYDPTYPYAGPHGYPYHHQVWAYDANDLVLVRQGVKSPWDVMPYALWTLSDIDHGDGTATVKGVTYDPATRRMFVVADRGGQQPEVHVYEITNAVLQPTRRGPQRLTATTSNGTWAFSWLPPTDAGWTSYQIEGGTASGLANVGALPLPPSANTFALPAPPSGTFYLRVRALYPDGGNPPSNEVMLTAGARPDTPTPIQVTAAASGSTLTVTWSGAVGAAVSDVLLDAGTAPGLSNIVAGLSIGASGSFVAGGVPPGHYYLRLRGVGQGGVSGVSNEADVIVGNAPGVDVPGAPEEFKASSSNSTVTMTWYRSESGGTPTGYRLEVGSRPGASDLIPGVALPAATSFVVPGVPAGTYYLRLRAVNAAGAGAPSGEVRLVVR